MKSIKILLNPVENAVEIPILVIERDLTGNINFFSVESRFRSNWATTQEMFLTGSNQKLDRKRNFFPAYQLGS